MAYISVLKLHPLYFKCHKIIPLVYDESLSYYEVLCKVTHSLNETITATNQLNDNVTDVNSRMNDVVDKVNEIADEINGFETEINDKFDQLVEQVEAELNEKFVDYDAQFAQLKEDTQAELEQLTADMNEFLQVTFPALELQVMNILRDNFELLSDELQEYIRTELQTIIDSIPEITTVIIRDPITGELVEIQTAIWNMFNWIVKDKLLTAEQLDSLQLTAYELDHYEVEGVIRGLTAFEWDSNTKEIFGWIDEKDKYRHYYDGSLVTLNKNVDFNNNLLRYSGCFTASEWDEENINVDTMDNSNFTVLEWDWKSNYLTA